jgi:hypothetical protein
MHTLNILGGAFMLWLIVVYRESIRDPEWKHNARMYRIVSTLLMIAFAWWIKH